MAPPHECHQNMRICSHDEDDRLSEAGSTPFPLPVPCTLFVPEGRQVYSAASTHPAAPPGHV